MLSVLKIARVTKPNSRPPMTSITQSERWRVSFSSSPRTAPSKLGRRVFAESPARLVAIAPEVLTSGCPGEAQEDVLEVLVPLTDGVGEVPGGDQEAGQVAAAPGRRGADDRTVDEGGGGPPRPAVGHVAGGAPGPGGGG